MLILLDVPEKGSSLYVLKFWQVLYVQLLSACWSVAHCKALQINLIALSGSLWVNA